MPPGNALWIALIASGLAATGCAAEARTVAPPFPEITKLRGKVVLLNFWETTCGPCKLEIPWLIEYENKYRGKGLSVLGVALDEDGWKSVKPFARRAKLNYSIMIGNGTFIARYRLEALPTTLLIDRQGKVAVTHVGLLDRARFDREIRALLDESTPKRAPTNP